MNGKQLEQEIKLALTQDEVLDLSSLEWLKPFIVSGIHQQHLISDYFDTPQLNLIKSGVGLRLRNDNGNWLQTVKCTGQVVDGLHQRQEWEWPLEQAEFDVTLLKQTPVKDIIDKPAIWSQVTKLFTTDFKRQAIQLTLADDTQVELAYDLGRVYSGDKQTPIHEIELELKSGSIETMKSLATQFCERLDVVANDASKAQLGYALLS